MSNTSINHSEASVPEPARNIGIVRGVETVCLILIAVVLTVASVTYLGPILKPFLIAVFLYYMIKPAVDFLARWRCPRGLAYLFLFLVVMIGFAAVARVAYANAVEVKDLWPDYKRDILKVVNRLSNRESESLREFLSNSEGLAKYVFVTTVDLVETSVLTFFYLLFIILGFEKYSHRVRRAFTGERGERLVLIGRRVSEGMEHYFKVKSTVNLGLAISSGLIMALFGVNYWLLWACLFFALNYISYVGSIVACVPPILVAAFQLPSHLAALVFASLLVANRFLWIDFLEIRFSGKRLNIDSVLMFLWLAYWGWVWGVVGLVLAFPMLNSLKIILASIESTTGWAVVMSED